MFMACVSNSCQKFLVFELVGLPSGFSHTRTVLLLNQCACKIKTAIARASGPHLGVLPSPVYTLDGRMIV